VNGEIEEPLRRLGEDDGRTAPRSLRRIGEARRDLASNVNKQLLLEVLLLDSRSGGRGRA